MKRNFLNSFLTGVITSSLVFTPTSFAKPAADASTNQRVEELKKVLNETKIDSVKSYSELWQRIQKSNLNKEQLGLIKNIFSALNGQKVPEMKFQEFKYKGKSAIKMISTIQGEQVVVEYLFTNNEAMKVNGVVLTYEDLKNQKNLQTKIGSLRFVKKGYAAFKKEVFSHKVMPDFKTWNKLTSRQKAEYLLRYRSLLEASYKVFDQSPFKVVMQEKSNSLQEVVKFLFLGEESFAQDNEIGTTKKAPAGTPADQSATLSNAKTPTEAKDNVKEVMSFLNTAPFLGEGEGSGKRKSPSCVVAAYAIEWKGNACPWNGSGNFYKDNPTSLDCKKSNGNGWIACNPLVYGFNDDGKPYCINSKTPEFQIATHGSGPCETKSPLKTVEDKKLFIERWLKKTKIDGEVTKEKKADGTFGLFTKNEKLYNAFTSEIQKPLNDFINSAFKVCTAVDSNGSEKDVSIAEATTDMKYKYKEGNKPPKGKKPPKGDPAKQDDACDALLKRAIEVKQLLEPVSVSGNVIATSDCGDWTPAGSARPGSDGACICDMNKGFKFDASKPKTCVKTGSDSGVAVVEPTEAAGVATEEATVANIDPTCPADASWFSSFIPGNGCKMNGTHWFAAGLTGFAILCLTENIKIDGLCGDKKKNKGSNPQNGNDPVPPPLTPTVTTTVTTPPTDSPRSSEGSTIDTSVDGANGSVPGMAR